MSKWNPDFDLDLGSAEFTEKMFASILKLDGQYIEIKDESDPKSCPKTGNLFIEVKQPDRQTGEPKPSGISTTKANWWVERFAPNAYLVVTTDRLKEYIKEQNAAGNLRFRKGGDRNKFDGVLVRLLSFVEWVRRK